MLKARARVPVLHRQLHPRLGTRRRPKSRRIFRRFTHLHAGFVRASFRAVTVAGADCGGPQLPRRVGRQNQRRTQNTSEQKNDSNPQVVPSRSIAREDEHGRNCARDTLIKPIAHAARKNCYWGPGTGSSQRKAAEESRVPESVFSEFQSGFVGKTRLAPPSPSRLEVFVNK